MTQWKFLWYPRCSTARKAKAWLEEHQIKFSERDMIQDNPTAAELQAWHEQSCLPIKKLVNTSGKKYRELQLKDKIPQLSPKEIYELLSTDGMLVKRPILLGTGKVLVGFKEQEWQQTLL